MRLYLALILLSAGWTASAQTCTFSLNPTNASFSASGGNDTVAITLVSGSGTCSRTATSSASWISISFGTPGTGSGTVGYTVQSNPFTVERVGTLTIAGIPFTVTQAAGSCSYSISPSSATVAAGGASGSFNLTANPNSCPWTAVSSVEWLTLTSAASGTGSSTIRYTADGNNTSATRSGTIAIGSLNFTVSQTGQCSFTLNPTAANVVATGGTGSIAVTASASSCAWTATSNQPTWLTLTGTASGTGNGTVPWSAAANSTLQDRVGSISIGTGGFNVFQAGSSCTFSLSSNTGAFPASGGGGTFLVTSTCPWTPVSSNPDWITITSGPSTTGTGTVSFLVSGNTSTLPRTGSITVGNASYSITQPGVACSVNLGSTSVTVPASGADGSIGVLAGDGCNWVASTTSSWVTLTGASGAGSGTIGFTASPNPTAQPRQAVITVANQRFVMTQEAAQCDYLLAPLQASVGSAGGSGTVNVSTGCAWSASTSANWISFPNGASGTGTADLAYSVAANPASEPRTGSVRISGALFTIVQSGRNCTFVVDPLALVIGGRGGRAVTQVTGDKGCRWEPSKDADWLAIDTWSSINGSGSVTVSAPANPSPGARSATLSAGGVAVAVTQGGLEVILESAGAVLNAASFAAGPIAPGQLITIFGQGLGPEKAATLELAPGGQSITKTLASVQVLFDGVPAPLIYVSDKQVSVQVPYAVTGRPSVEMKVVNQGVESNPLTLGVAQAAPAIFTMNSSGRGPGAVLNQDGSLNGATNAAARNSIIQIFATGEGQTQPAGEDGRIAAGPNLPVPRQPVTVMVGNQNAAVVYAGAAPGAIAGLFQVNVRIPANAPTGAAVPITLRVGNVSSPAGVTIAIR